jgi:thiol:disulfide interchange protein DsbD
MPRHKASAILLLVGLLMTASHALAVPTATVDAKLSAATLKPGDQAELSVSVAIPAGYHAQSHTPLEKFYIPLTVTMDPNPAFMPGEASYPPGTVEEYPLLGKLSVYTGNVTVKVPLTVTGAAASGPLAIAGSVRLQMCDDKACYPPANLKFATDATITGGAASAQTPVTTAATQPVISAAPSGDQSSQGGLTFLGAMGIALLAGLLFNVMPCVLPVLPLKAVGFYEASQHNRARSFALGVVFSIGLISVFAALALVVLVFKFISWGDLFTKAWFIWGIIVPLLTIMGFGLLGGWNFSLPMGVYRFEPRHDTFGGNFFWGALTAVLATPCTAPFLPTLLIWASTQPGAIGVLAMVTVGVGMALPYLILSAMPEVAQRFPRTGPWSDLFKQTMGFLMIAAAVFFAAGRLIHGPEFFWAVVFVVAIASLYLIARSIQLTKEARPVMIAIVLAMTMLGASLWWTARITGLTASGSAIALEGGFHAYSDDAFKAARDSGKPVLVKFTANWCGSCQLIEGSVFRDPQIWKVLKDRGFEVMKVDFSDDSDAPGKALLLSLNPAGGIPLTAVYGPHSNTPVVLASVYSSGELLQALDSVADRKEGIASSQMP